MSSIVGHLGLDGDLNKRTERMLAACTDRGSHRPRTGRLEGPLRGAFGHAGYAATSHSIDELRPFRHEAGLTITADIRLDNREALRAQLLPQGGPAGDAELALLAYLRWGSTFAERLLGDFAVAIFDPRNGEIVLARDHLGVRPVLYATGRDWLVFGSTLVSVRDGADRQFEIYADKLQHVMINPLEVIEPETTFYRGIQRLPAASTMHWKPGQRPRIASYWRPERGELQLSSDEEYNDAFLEVFDRAVTCRLETTRPLAAMLSGGLDSSSVIARVLALQSEPLRTYGFVETSPEKGSDAPHIKTCQREFAGEHLDFSERDVANEFDLDVLLTDPDSPFDADMGVLWTTAQRMATDDFGVVLTGLGGDEAAAINPRTFASELLRSGERLQALREMSRSDGTWTLKALARFIGGEFGPRQVVDRLRQTRDSHAHLAESLEIAGIDPQSEDGRRLRASLETLTTRAEWNTGEARVDRVARPMLTIGLERYDRVAARHGIEIRHPMCDKRFIEFCLALPPHQLQRNGWSKHIVRAATPALPASVAWRPKESRSMSPAAQAVQHLQGPRLPVGPLEGVFGPSRETANPSVDHWYRHVVREWWTKHS